MARKKKFELNDNNLAIAYYRFSSHSQNEASIDQQRELAHAWADAHGFKIVKEYEDAAISGTTEDRPGFQQMLSEVAKIRPRVLIMWKTDRLGRDKYVLAMAKRTIRDAGCEIRLLAENIPTDGPEGVLIEGLMDAMAEYYSRQLSQNIQRGMDYNAQHALYNGHKLFGYGVDKSTKRYVVDPDTAPFVQRMFAEYAEGKAMQTICDELNAQGLRTTRGAKFGVKTMNKMLQNRALNEAIEAENIRAALCEDEHTIKAYFEKFLHADFDNPETRDQVLEYFVDKIYLTDDGLVVTSWYSEDRTEVTWDMLYGEDGNPFVKGEAVKFDCFPFGSTNSQFSLYIKAFLFLWLHFGQLFKKFYSTTALNGVALVMFSSVIILSLFSIQFCYRQNRLLHVAKYNKSTDQLVKGKRWVPEWGR